MKLSKRMVHRAVHMLTCLVGTNGLLNPAHVVADLGVDTRFAFLSTANTPGDNALELSVADHRATRVTLCKREETVRTPNYAKMGARFNVVSPLPWVSFPRLLIL